MPNKDVLYCKGMDLSESDDDEVENDQWDDSQLNAAYDKALKLANVEVAKRIALATNSKTGGRDNASSEHSNKHSKKQQWKVGMPCRATYEEDGLEYEAFVLQILNDKECIVKFLGYDNSEKIDMSTMKPSLGKKAQQIQIQEANQDGDETDTTLGTDRELLSDRGHSPGSAGKSHCKKDSRKKKRQPQTTNGFNLPEIPMPDMNKLRNMGSMDIPMPPPLPFLSTPDGGEDQAVSSMLISWYMSGYYTGLYQGLKRSKPNNKRHKD